MCIDAIVLYTFYKPINMSWNVILYLHLLRDLKLFNKKLSCILLYSLISQLLYFHSRMCQFVIFSLFFLLFL